MTSAKTPSEDEYYDGRVLIYVKKNGFPVDDFAWEKLHRFASKSSLEGEKSEKNSNLPSIGLARARTAISNCLEMQHKVNLVQRYMKELHYNFTDTQSFDVGKYRPITGLMNLAKEMIKESLPIKCLEATLCSLIIDYKKCYENNMHKLKTAKIGSPLTHDQYSYEKIPWKGVTINFDKISEQDLVKEIDKHSKFMRLQSKSMETVQNAYMRKCPTLKGHTMPVIMKTRAIITASYKPKISYKKRSRLKNCKSAKVKRTPQTSSKEERRQSPEEIDLRV
ncbi:DgyrCDS13798 [Dimorphilus gyrociliatus]|uniref:DgyrCDS13798 n=1 Tax=Dimorphilus gyrociliatus TaxID=2664684 RepID=A0A7I8WBU0_9ANNE|nr:DgyrCDS13798 [Dimorphilus gyrociliatus]